MSFSLFIECRSNCVLTAKRTDDGISFKDEYFKYHLHIGPDGESYIKVFPYATEFVQN